MMTRKAIIRSVMAYEPHCVYDVKSMALSAAAILIDITAISPTINMRAVGIFLCIDSSSVFLSLLLNIRLTADAYIFARAVIFFLNH